MSFAKLRPLGPVFALVSVLLGVAIASTPAKAQDAQPPSINEVWAESVAETLDLTPAQRALLDEFVTTAAKGAAFPSPTIEQLRAMNLVESLDYATEHQSLALENLKADNASLRRFYDALSADQKVRFGAATRPPASQSRLADAPVESPAPKLPNFKLPARTAPDWLVKPTAEVISRVYPSAAVRNRISGKVTLRCVADEDGYLTECDVVSETPAEAGFGNAALEATGYMRMKPGTYYGVPIRSEVRIPLDFSPKPAR